MKLGAGKIIQRRPLASTGDLPSSLHPVLHRIYRARQVTSPQELEQSLERLIPPVRLKGTREAARVLADAIERQRRLLIVADFDLLLNNIDLDLLTDHGNNAEISIIPNKQWNCMLPGQGTSYLYPPCTADEVSITSDM